MEECNLLTEARGLVEKEEMREWGTRHSHDKKKKKGDVGTEKKKEGEEGERIANFFSAIYEFFVPTTNATNAFVPAELPARYAIDFVPAVSAATDFVPAVSAASPVPDLLVSDLFHNPTAPASVPVFDPADLPPRYAINFVPAVNISASVSDFVPAASPVSDSPVPASASSPDYSIVSSANFVIPPVNSLPTCIESSP